MKVPVSYSFRNLWTRRLTTILTAAGMALVVFVFAAILMLAEGLQKTLVDTGSWDNVVLIRKGSQSEVQSGIERLQASIIETQPEVAMQVPAAGGCSPRRSWCSSACPSGAPTSHRTSSSAGSARSRWRCAPR